MEGCISCIISVVDGNASLDQRLQHMGLPKGSSVVQGCASVLKTTDASLMSGHHDSTKTDNAACWWRHVPSMHLALFKRKDVY